jgi:hypothetical protein
MNTRFLKRSCLLLATGGLGILVCTNAFADDTATQKTVAQTLAELQQQGFKTDLSNFDFSTSPELQAREKVLTNAAPNRNSAPFLDHPNLMEPLAANSNNVIVVWQQDGLRRPSPAWQDNSYQLTWDDFRQAINQRQPQMDAACAAILAGPVEFNLDASAGNYMLLRYLALLIDLTQTLDDRAMLALHDGNRDEAWTNLMAATRLITAWNPEPAKISHQTRFDNAKLVFAATWQVLQTNGWTDDQLARLQHEWETADFLSSLPEIPAFRRASDLTALEKALPPQAPVGAVYDDEERMLLEYRACEMDYRLAVQAATWAQMQPFADATNDQFFLPQYYYRGPFGMVLNERRMREGLRMRLEGPTPSLLGQAAEAETERRIMVTALALERYETKYGRYPETLQGLTPEFLKTVPLDFMNGQPLHYQVADDGNFLLYSVGLDGVDNGGKIPVAPTQEEKYARLSNPDTSPPVPESDIVWPLPASSGQAVARRKEQSDVDAARNALMQAEEKSNAERAEELRQDIIKNLLAMEPPFITKELDYQGVPVRAFLQNTNTVHGIQLSMDDLFTLKKITNGGEPDMAAFEVPISYDNLKKVGELRLLVDAGGPEPTNSIWVDTDPAVRAYQGDGELQDVVRATNGDCLIEWNTDYDPPGRHALRAQLLYSGGRMDYEVDLRGPVTPYYSSNLVQFFEGTSMFTDKGATLYAQTAEPHAIYTIEIKAPDGKHLKTFTGTITNGIINVNWDLRDDHGNICTNQTFESVFNVTLPDSGRSQTVQ